MTLPRIGQAIVAIAIVLTLLGSQSSAGTVNGTATYRERIALPQDATLFVELQDISRADAPAVTLAAQRFALSGVPAEFAITFDDALIREGMTYAVSGSIYQDDTLLFATDTIHPVVTGGAGHSTDLVLVQVSGQEAALLDDTRWTAIGMEGSVLSAERPPEIAFAQSGTFGGTGGCNRFSGQAEISGNNLKFPDNMAATLMACPPPLDEVEDQFLAALQRVYTFALAGDSLVFLDAAGEPVLKLIRTK